MSKSRAALSSQISRSEFSIECATKPRLFGGKRDVQVSLLIGLFCLLIYNVNGRAISAGDAFPARYLPFAIWGHRTVLLDPIETVTSQGRERPISWRHPHPGAAFWMVPTSQGHLVSLYSVELPVLISPLYLPAVIYLHQQGWTDERVDHVARIMEKLTASFIAALSASILYLALRRRTAVSIAVLLTVAYAFGTTTWVISSQALWQHGMAQLLVAGLILLLTGPCTVSRALAAGFLCGLIAGNRPADAVLALSLGVYGLFWAGRRLAGFFGVAALGPVIAVLSYNVTVVGAVSGAYQLVGRADSFFRHDVSSGLAGLLFSPTRGLFVFSPFLLFLILFWRDRPRDRGGLGLTLAMIAAVAVQVLLYSKTDWRGGIAWGPRFLTDLLPLLIWLLAPVVAKLGGLRRICFIATVCIAIAIEAVGAFTYNGVTDVPIYAIDKGPHKLRPAWEWQNAPFLASLSSGLAPPELAELMRGTIDTLEVDGHATDTIVAGQDVVATGWALAGRATPLQAGITIDGRETTAVRVFFDRPDVRHAFPGAAPAGWRIPLKTARLAPGKHRLSLYLWAFENGDTYFLTRRTVTVQMPQAEPSKVLSAFAAPAKAMARPDAQANGSDLDASFRIAAARIREHQGKPGYWLTAFTRTTQFAQPHQEMNTYLTSLLIDLLDPVPAGLGDSVERARQHLSTQIEANGLVRYHGLPDAPGIGTLGCVITPDTDDTALVWRIAPSQNRRKLSAALSMIDTYRTRDGLYRTWLAPREAYQCLDPGSDPNPTDIAIQMHLLQLLLQEKQPAARPLCESLRRHIDEDRIWVYYRLSPLVPMLRARDLAQAGCQLALPEARMRTTVPGQQIWITAAQLSSRGSRPGVSRSDAAEITSVLRQLSNEDFALVRQSPPLLYHNDLTATVPRYYWSEDVGYALWLRLAHEVRHFGAPGSNRSDAPEFIAAKVQHGEDNAQ